MRRVLPRSAPAAPAGLTLVEVLMSMMVASIGILAVIVLLPLSFVRSIQAINLTNGTILRYNAEAAIDVNPRLLLRWQANQAYNVGDIIVLTTPPTAFVVQTAGTSGLQQPAWNFTAPGTTPDGTGALVWQLQTAGFYKSPMAVAAGSQYPLCFVIDPLGANTPSLAAVAGALGNNGATPPIVDPNTVPRFNGELSIPGTAMQGVTLPDSWVEQARGPVTAFTPISATITGPDLSTVAPPAAPALPATVYPLPVISRVVLIDQTGKASQTRLLTGITPATGVVSWSDPLTGTFTPVAARVETQDTRYSWILTVRPTSGGANVTVTVFFNRPLVSTDEIVYPASGTDGVQAPFQITVPPSNQPQPNVKKGGFLFDCYFGRWYRILNVIKDPNIANTLDVYVDSPRPQSDLIAVNTGFNPSTFGAVFMRGVVDQFPLPLK
jgi:Tfp pilus assembly protein PilV